MAEIRIIYHGLTDERAREILDDFSKDSRYLRSLVGSLVNGEYADSLDYRKLLWEGYRIKAICKKIEANKNRRVRRVDISEEIGEAQKDLRIALGNRDAPLYFESADKLGIARESLEDPYLYDQGHVSYIQGRD